MKISDYLNCVSFLWLLKFTEFAFGWCFVSNCAGNFMLICCVRNIYAKSY